MADQQEPTPAAPRTARVVYAATVPGRAPEPDPQRLRSADPHERRLAQTALKHEWTTMRARYGDLPGFWEMVRRDVGQ